MPDQKIPQILHQVMHARLTRIIHKTRRRLRQPRLHCDGDNLTRRAAARAAAIPLVQQLQERHRGLEHGRDVRLQRVVPDGGGAVVEEVVRISATGASGFGMGRAFGEPSQVVWPALLIRRSMWPVSAVIWSTARWRSSREEVLPWIGMMLLWILGGSVSDYHRAVVYGESIGAGWKGMRTACLAASWSFSIRRPMM